jgi:hypothetical protein
VEKEREHKALEQRRKEVMSRVVAKLVAENKKIQDAQSVATGLAQALSEMEELNAVDPGNFTWTSQVPPVTDRFGSGWR